MAGKKILPIVQTPYINSYVHHSYPLSIVEDKNICSLYVSDSENNSWTISDTDADVLYDGTSELLTVKNAANRTDSSVYIKRRCDIRDEVIVKVNDFEITDNLSYIRLSVGTDEQFSAETDAFFRWNQYDITVKERLIAYNGHFSMYYRIRRTDKLIEVCASIDKSNWGMVYSMQLESDPLEEIYFYVKIFFGENIFEYWKNMNYIQLVYNGKDDNTVYLDYFTYPRKNYDASYQEFSLFLDTEYLFLDDCIESYGDVEEFIRKSILHGYYVNMDIDEQFIPERQDLEKKEFFHFNLIHGFNDEENVFYALGYNQSGELQDTPIQYKVLERKNLGNNVVRYKKNTNKAKYELSIDYITNSIKELINGVDSSRKFQGIIGKQPGVYGLKVFEEMLHDKRGMELVVTDRRLSFLLYEHCVLMMDRLGFIDKFGYIKNAYRDSLYELGRKMLKASELLKNNVIKNIYKQNLQEKILFQLNELYQCEKLFYSELLKALTDVHEKM